MPLISFFENNLFHRMTRRPSILLQLSRECTEQMLRMTRLPLQMLGNRKEIKLLLLETTHCTYLISFLFFFFHFQYERHAIVFFCFLKIRNSISSLERWSLDHIFPFCGSQNKIILVVVVQLLHHVQLFMDCGALPGFSVPGILQARIDISFSRGSSQPRDQIQVSCIAGRFFTYWNRKKVLS